MLRARLHFKLLSAPAVKAYLGNAYMYEHEKNDNSDIEYYNNRNSTYVSFTINFPKITVNITETLYFQPKYNDLGNYRVFRQLQAQFPINIVLSFTTQFTNFYNSFVTDVTRDYSSDISQRLRINI